VVHHRNRDRSDNQLENLEVLCRSCHQREHEAHRNFLASSQKEHAGRTVSEDSQSLSGFPADCP
jgi:5-methylcytosine-specific restriction endonuclease McrA